jgi:hypothetical protein
MKCSSRQRAEGDIDWASEIPNSARDFYWRPYFFMVLALLRALIGADFRSQHISGGYFMVLALLRALLEMLLLHAENSQVYAHHEA